MCYFLFLLLLLIIFFCSVCCCAYQEAMMSAYFVCEWSCNRFQYRNTHSQTQPYRQQTHILLMFILRRLLFRIRFCWLYGRTHWMWLNWSQGSRDMSPQPQTRLWPSLNQADNLPTERPTKERERSTCYENNAKFIWSNDIRCASVHILTIHIYVRQNRTTQTLSSNANYIQFNHTEMDDNTKFYWLKEEEKKTNRQSIRRFIYVGVWPSLEINY